MHFHVLEQVVGEPVHHLGGVSTLRYPSERPTFALIGDAIDAAMDSAHSRWGVEAEDAVELELMTGMASGEEYCDEGATAAWRTAGGDSGATWSVQACDCADGTLAQIFVHHRSG